MNHSINVKRLKIKMTLTLCLFSAGLSAQTITGKLVDEQNQPLPYANIVLLSLPDSAFVNGTISGEDGGKYKVT